MQNKKKLLLVSSGNSKSWLVDDSKRWADQTCYPEPIWPTWTRPPNSGYLYDNFCWRFWRWAKSSSKWGRSCDWCQTCVWATGELQTFQIEKTIRVTNNCNQSLRSTNWFVKIFKPVISMDTSEGDDRRIERSVDEGFSFGRWLWKMLRRSKLFNWWRDLVFSGDWMYRPMEKDIRNGGLSSAERWQQHPLQSRMQAILRIVPKE